MAPYYLLTVDPGTQLEYYDISEKDRKYRAYQILSGTWEDAEIAQYAEVFRKNVAVTLNAEVKARALTPNIICVGITVDENLRNELKYYFENVTSAKVRKNSGWINVPEYLEGGCQPDRVNSYLVKVKDGHGNVRTLEKSGWGKTGRMYCESCGW